ncbi:hypothetical protein QBC36DRAFT_53569 [Triangularia setosa]|uniref:Protein NO VEIN C-terminal domain-containing protein n=1 Tax=Triangularia setosa TaxID=2587417 RepID=A0AAN6W1X1_9PEZI|nr:hypothetical protein QBC36DRAFT_53569 [Podospora setosa]
MAETTRPSNRAEARQLVESIAESHGRIRPEIWNRVTGILPEAVLQELQRALDTRDRLIGSSVMTLARNLYTSTARFIFELLQNAEDNDYSEALAHGEVPKVSFSVYSNHVVLECNEDGFTKANLRAICDIGKSSKTAAQCYIGEKGIGFKSVFMAADRVHVQSGHFCFQFTHRKGDTGMGMITPIWEEAGLSVGDRCTRITLQLQHAKTPEDRERRNQVIHQQLNEIHDTILLFMKKIQEIEIAFYDREKGEADEPYKVITLSIKRTGAGAVCTKHTLLLGQEGQTEIQYYHVTDHVATGLAKSQGRTYSESEESSGAYSRGEVVLAFPMTAISVPVVDNQWLFAFLPVRQMGFKFLIHADFDTQANRQDIVTTSTRNQGLATGIADAFIKAVLQLCDHPTLRFEWMRYLPQQDAYPWDDFWKDVITKIKDRIMSTPVVVPAKPGPLRLIDDCWHHRSDAIDRDGKPLFRDISPEKYFSSLYQDSDLVRLKDYGLQYIAMGGIINRARADLASVTSRIKTQVNEDWQTRVAKILHLPFRMGWQNQISEVKALYLLPLRTGQWTSAISGPVYYAKVKDTELAIPSGLPFKVIDPAAAANSAREQLFDAVGVKNASVADVQSAVISKCQNGPLTLAESVEYLRLLFLTQCFTQTEYGRLRVFNHREVLQNGWDVDIYTESDDPYGAKQLFRPTAPGPDYGCGAPGLEVSFIHEAYFEDPPSLPNPTEDGLALWGEWLAVSCNLSESVSIYDFERRELTFAGNYVAKNRPEKFVGLLRESWAGVLESRARRDNLIIDAIGQIPVLCQGPETTLQPLKSTYLPYGEPLELCRRFMTDSEYFPWLKLEDPLSDTVPLLEWSGLISAFGLVPDGQLLDFVLVVLKHIDPNRCEKPLERPDRMYQLYAYLQSKIGESNHAEGCQEKIRTAFTSGQGYIYLPGIDNEGKAWVTPEDCLWSAPVDLMHITVLKSLYYDAFSLSQDQILLLKMFFVHTLKISAEADWNHIVEEIRWQKNCKGMTLPEATELYTCLSDMGLAEQQANDLKQAFLDEALIFFLDDNGEASWHKISDCLWSSATAIRGKVVLDGAYGGLRDFFVNTLKAAKMTTNMVYDKLKAQHDESFSVREARETLLVFNSLLAAGSEDFDPAPILQNRVFPVRFPGGDIRLCRSDDAFSLLDHEPLGEAFAHVAKFLDFDLQELQILQPFIQWAGLGNRYLSASVKEITSADSESTRTMSSPHREIRAKAHALLRIAVHFNSPRTQLNRNAFYTYLRNSRTLETDGITAELLLSQGNQVHRVERESVLLHIHEDNNELTVYVPRNEQSQEVCFNSKLPLRLFEWLITNPTTQIPEPVASKAITTVYSVLNAKAFALEGILAEQGISGAGIPNIDGEEAGEHNALVHIRTPSPAISDPTEETLVSRSETSFRPSPWALPHQGMEREESSDDEGSAMATPQSSATSPAPLNPSYVAAQSRYVSSRPSLRPIEAYAVEGNIYLRLLHNIVRVARSATFPSRGAFDMSNLRAALPGGVNQGGPEGETYRIRSVSQMERDKQIGAAGELFAFELLSRLQPALPGFSRANWQSTIRHYVSAHPDYSDIGAWVGNETSDIVYDDNDGEFTRLLIDRGHLNANSWTTARPRYFIEVKATTSGCGTRFFMSKAQYRRMQENTNGNGNRRTVYVIFRVFNLEAGNVELKVLIDPESMRTRDELSFKAESWSVVTSD